MKFTQEKKRIQEKNRKQDTKGIKHDKDKLHLHLTLVKRGDLIRLKSSAPWKVQKSQLRVPAAAL